MSSPHSDLIDPQFRVRRIRVNVMDCRRETDDVSLLNRHNQMMARILEKFFRAADVYRDGLHTRHGWYPARASSKLTGFLLRRRYRHVARWYFSPVRVT